MLPLLFGVILLLFMLVGALAFLVSVIVPPIRRYALSIALWCAVWGPCSIAVIMVAGLGLLAEPFIANKVGVRSIHATRLPPALGWGYVTVGALCTAAVATLVACMHQWIVRRFTFALFRLYATAIVGCIGGVFGCCLTWWVLSRESPNHFWAWFLTGMIFLMSSFGTIAYRGARRLRGEPPRQFTWISDEEFTGL